MLNFSRSALFYMMISACLRLWMIVEIEIVNNCKERKKEREKERSFMA